MTTEKLQTRIGIGLILAQFAILASVIILRFTGGFGHDEMKTTVALILPMFAIYTTAIVSLFTQPVGKNPAESPMVESRTLFVTVFFPLVFVLSLLTMVFLKAWNIGFKNFEEFKDMLAIIETVFAVYLATVLSSLFSLKFKSNSNSQ